MIHKLVSKLISVLILVFQSHPAMLMSYSWLCTLGPILVWGAEDGIQRQVPLSLWILNIHFYTFIRFLKLKIIIWADYIY